MLKEKDRIPLDLGRLRNARRRTVSLSLDELIRTEFLDSKGTLPLVVKPNLEEINIASWAGANLDFLETRLLKHGGILFRGFSLNSAPEFKQFAASISPKLGDYLERSTPRTEVVGKVYTSTEYPADQYITLHNEQAYSRTWPMKIWFYCHQPPLEGGETPIADSRQVLSLLPSRIKERFIDKKVMYVRNYGQSLDLSWQNVFQTSDRFEVENYCRRAGIDFEWKNDGGLRTRQVCQAVAKHPKTDEMVWFNQAHLFHISSVAKTIRESLIETFGERNLPRNAYYGDGSAIEDSILDEVRAIYQEAAVCFPWQKSDVLMLDNMLTAHGRMPFVGPRQVLVAMAELFTNIEISGK